jgi:hypothetical protein
MSGFIYGVSDGLFVDVFRMIARVEELEGRLLFDDDTVKRIAKDNEDLNNAMRMTQEPAAPAQESPSNVTPLPAL